MFQITTHSLRAAPGGDKIARILSAGIQAVEPGSAVNHHVQRVGDTLFVDEQAYSLDLYKRVLVVGAGKAGAPMAAAVAQILGERCSGGVVVVKEGHTGDLRREPTKKIKILEAGHPIPDERGVQAAKKITNLLEDTTPEDLVICPISGGGSALLVSPAAGVTLDDLQHLTASLLACGATINEINTLRKHLECLKGGGLARLAAPGRLLALILSDVINDPLDIIASGPTVPDPSSFAEAWRILERYALLEQAPASIQAHLRRGLQGDIPDTPKPGDAVFRAVQNVIIGNNMQAAQAALKQARLEGFQPLLLTTSLQGEARQAGRMLASIARQMDATGEPLPRPACVIAGGETTVTLSGNGLGGRNQEVALGAARDLAGVQDVILAALATDGGDGPTDAAGAVVTGETMEQARQAGLEIEDFLRRNDAYHFFDPLGDLIRTGPTLTNVNDLYFIFAL